MLRGKYIFNLLIGMFLVLSISPGASAQEISSPSDDPGVWVDGEPVSGLTFEEGINNVSWAFSGGPDYDSSWIAVQPDSTVTLSHNLGGDVGDYVVDMQYRDLGFNGVNQRHYGGADFGINPPGSMSANDRVGAYWRSLTNSTITVYRRPEDPYADQLRIRIWKDPIPGFDSGWVVLTAGTSATTLTHSMGGDPTDYLVDMQYRTGGSNGINQRYFGGADFGINPAPGHNPDDRVGAYWRNLDASTITVYRRPDDSYVTELRVRIWNRPTPTYDSGWVALNQDAAQNMLHNIGGNPNDYVVDMQYRSPGSGINLRYYGGADFGVNPPAGMNADDRVGAYWRSLDDTSITVYRRPEDIYAPEVRIRIWCFWTPPPPDFDSGWQALETDIATDLNHGLGGNTDDYLVDMQYMAENIDGVNLRYYGGADFGTSPAPGHINNDRVGSYWRSLTNSSITVYRRPEDTYAPSVRIRIWVMPKADFDSGWISLAPGSSTTQIHNLQGDYFDYKVDLQSRSTGSGVNQRYYGGTDFGANAPSGSSENNRVGVYWRSLDLNSITIYRRPDDIYSDQVRIRIWRTAKPNYESGWQVVSLDTAESWSHNLGNKIDNYLVDMLYYDTDFNFINQRHMGGADYGAMPPAGYSTGDRVGAYWRSLTDSDITIYRRPEDGFADYIRIRIWQYSSNNIFLPITLKE